MLFNSYEFLLAFLPIAIAGYFAISKWVRGTHFRADSNFWPNAWLVGCSLFFYAWWRAPYIALLAVSIAVNFTLGRAIMRRAAMGIPGAGLMRLGVVFNLAVLGYFKYANFFAENVAALLHLPAPHLAVLLPIGISFFTFTQIAFLVDAHHRKAAEPSLVNYALFVTYFPHLLAGPILHHREMMPQFTDRTNRSANADNIARGLALLTIGLAKKVLIADTLAVSVGAGYGSPLPLSFTDAWFTAICYTMQIYFDFSGYTDMALGMSLMMNIRLPQNFDSPYRQRNLREFWRHWHMTLTRFLRDYVYIPLGGNRRGEAYTAFALVLTFALGGLWHGANWTFVLWGVVNGVGLVIVRWWGLAGRALPAPAAWAITFLFVNLGWVLFRAPDLDTAGRFLATMAGADGFGGLHVQQPAPYTLAILALACILAAWPRNSNRIAAEMSFGWMQRAATAVLLALAVLSVGNPTEFLYFNF